MKRVYRSIYRLLFVLALACQGCHPIYRASLPNQPIMEKRGDIELSSGIETGSAFVEGSYAFTDFAYVTVGGFSWSSMNSSASFAEGGLGFYQTKEKTGFSFSILGGYGESAVFDGQWRVTQPIFQDGGFISTRYSRLSIQPAYYVHREYFDFAMIFRNSLVNWISTDFPGLESPGFDIYLEPTLSFRAGPPNTKFFFDTGLQVPAFRSFNHFNNPLHVGVGVDVIIQTRK